MLPMITMKNTAWQEFLLQYGMKMYSDKISITTRPSDEDPDYIEIICGQGIDYSGYDLIEEFLKTQAKQGATHDQRT
jgi:hypothetical protein